LSVHVMAPGHTLIVAASGATRLPAADTRNRVGLPLCGHDMTLLLPWWNPDTFAGVLSNWVRMTSAACTGGGLIGGSLCGFLC
jgi:hypothetical protein